MSAFGITILAFGGLLYFIVGSSMRDRFAHLRRYPRIRFSLLALELVGFGFILALAPALRTRPGLMLALPMAFTVHLLVSYYAAEGLKKQDLIDPEPLTQKRRLARATHETDELTNKSLSIYFYVGLAVIYLVVIGLVLAIRLTS